MKNGRGIDKAWPSVAALLAVVMAGVPAAWAQQTITYVAATDVWLRQSAPDTTYENDPSSVWSSSGGDGGNVRYGVIEFDVSALTGKTLRSAELRLYQGAWDVHNPGMPLKQTTYNIATGPTTIGSLTWNIYTSEKDADKQAFAKLGRFDLAPINYVYGYQSAIATVDDAAADLAIIEAEANGDGKLTLAMIADEDGTPYRRDWGDIEWAKFPPMLVVDDGTDCAILTTSLPLGHLNSPYSGTLLISAGCTGAQWAVVGGALPDGLTLEPATGAITGTPGTAGTFPFKVEMASAVATRTADLSITVVGDQIELTATTEVWIRQSSPDRAAYEGDGISVWSSYALNPPPTSDRRYGLLEFDVSGLAGLTLQNATLSLYSHATHSALAWPIKQSAFTIPSAGTALPNLTWNAYMSEKDPQKVALTRLGRYSLAANDSAQANTYENSQASAADLTMIAAEASGDGKLTLVMIATEDGTDYRRDWGDDTTYYDRMRAKLTVLTGSGCVINTDSLPDAEQAAYYEAQLDRSPGCGTGTWSVTNCFLPPGLVLNPATGLISGWPRFPGPFSFTVQVTPTGGGQPQQKDLTINVAGSPADLNADGAVDADDFTEFTLEYTGLGGPSTCDMGGGPPSDVITLDATEDVWLRESDPDGVHDDDLVSVWSVASEDRRYGLVTFNLSAVAGQTIQGAMLELYDTMGGSQQNAPIKQNVSIVPGNALNATWNSYMANQDPSAQLLDGLRHNLPGPKNATYKPSTSASAADIAKIQAAVAGGTLTLAMKADEDGTDYRVDWGDIEYLSTRGGSKPARLHLIVGPPCTIATLALPAAPVGAPYFATLEASGGCTGTLSWKLIKCELPTGLTLDSATGVISGTAHVTGTFPFRVQLTSTQGTRTRDLSITVTGRPKADFDGNGVVDLLDFDTFALAFTGPVGSRPFCGTVNFTSADTPMPIPDAGSVSSVINVSGDLTISDLNVFVDIAHPGAEAVKIVLRSPAGTTVMLQDFSTQFGSFVPTTYDDEGPVQPIQPLSAFDGQNAAGNWTLTVEDLDEIPDGGSLSSWKLTVAAQ